MLTAGGVSAGELSAGNVPTQFPGLLPTNVTLLQPGSLYQRLIDALIFLDQSGSIAALGTSTATLQSSIAALQASIATLQGEINSLNGQIATINARLAAANIP